MVSAVIFDCDGVLVDSEVLIHKIELEILADLGMHYESGPFKARFMGMSDNAYYDALDLDALERLGRKIQSEARPLGNGLKSMRKRAAAIGASVEMKSKPGEGCSVKITLSEKE